APGADRARYAADTGWTHLLAAAGDGAALTCLEDDGRAAAPIPPATIARAADGDAAAIATIVLATRRT
ncbi:MAG TPA: hypothetical protein VHE35_05835, partial [Kofleriaceae bacterium]|nr:hypothetical protein [Kofleriaceae bacterium]